MARRRRQPKGFAPADETPEKALCRRVRKLQRKGESRRALLTLRQAAFTHEGDAPLWVRYGVQCLRMGKADAGREALRHAVWLRERSNEYAKARTTAALLDRHDATLAA